MSTIDQSARLLGPLTLVVIEDDWSIYKTRTQDWVYLQHGTARVLVPFNEIDIDAAWREFVLESLTTSIDDFRDWVADRTYEPDYVEEIDACADCGHPQHADDFYGTNDNHGSVCESCLDNYWTCEHCENRFPETTTTLHDDEVCDRCRDNYYSWCDECEGYYHHDFASDHTHGGCDCESPKMQFTVRNDGAPALANDVRTTVTLPAGEISDVGIQAIRNLLYNYAYNFEFHDPVRGNWNSLSYDMNNCPLGTQWQTKEGNFTKRLSRYAYKTYGLKLPPEVMSQVGNIASDHSRAVDFAIEVTRGLNLPPGDFANEDSCWWQSYAASRCALKSNGGFGLRTFNGDYVSGRAWVMPLRRDWDGRLTPTFETREPDAFVVFNGYGDLTGYAPARIVAHMAGMTYRKISFTCSPMYVNAEAGYLIAPEDIAEGYTDGSLHLDVDQHSNLFHTEPTCTEHIHTESRELVNA